MWHLPIHKSYKNHSVGNCWATREGEAQHKWGHGLHLGLPLPSLVPLSGHQPHITWDSLLLIASHHNMGETHLILRISLKFNYFGQIWGLTQSLPLQNPWLLSSCAAAAPYVWCRGSLLQVCGANEKEICLASPRKAQECSAAALIWSFLQTAGDKQAMKFCRWSLAVYK